MSGEQTLAFLPLLVLAATPVALMLVLAFLRDHRLALGLTLGGFAASFGLLFVAARHTPLAVTPLFVVDRYAVFYTGLILAAGFAVALLAYGYLERKPGPAEEFYLLLLLATLGATALVSSDHFASFFLGLELLSVSLYGLIGYDRRSPFGAEAAMKYLVLAGVSSAFLLFGMSLIYARLGTMQLTQIVAEAADSGSYAQLVLTGFGLMTVGIGFKLALVPFHLWTPDVYQGAPAPVSAFVATVSKGAMFALLQRYFTPMDFRDSKPLWVIFASMAAASMLAGNLLALRQRNVKRLLAYSSIAHLGYLLVAFLASNPEAVAAVGFYLVAYFVTTLGAFGAVTALSHKEKDAETLDDYVGLAWRQPFLASVLTAMFLSLAGIPLTFGFMGKFFILSAGATVGVWWLLFILVAASAIGLVYYLRVVFALYRRPEHEPARVAVASSWTSNIVLGALTLLLVGLGIYPGPLIGFIESTLGRLQ